MDLVNKSEQLNCILETYDKDYEKFFEHIEKLKQTSTRGYQIENKENISHRGSIQQQ